MFFWNAKRKSRPDYLEGNHPIILSFCTFSDCLFWKGSPRLFGRHTKYLSFARSVIVLEGKEKGSPRIFVTSLQADAPIARLLDYHHQRPCPLRRCPRGARLRWSARGPGRRHRHPCPPGRCPRGLRLHWSAPSAALVVAIRVACPPRRGP